MTPHTTDQRVQQAIAHLPGAVGSNANIATLICHRHALARPQAPAVIEDHADQPARVFSFADLDRLSDAAAAALSDLAVQPGQPVAIHLPQGAQHLAAILGALKLGAIAMPVATVYGPDGLLTRLAHSHAPVLVTDTTGAAKLPHTACSPRLPRVLLADSIALTDNITPSPQQEGLCRRRRPDDPALLLYSSGTSGTPKGVLLAHRLLSALLPGFRLVFDLAPQPGDVFWTPSEWSWLGGLQVVLCALYHAHPVVASTGRFTPASTYYLLARHRITSAFLAPAALRRLRAEPPSETARFVLRAIMTGGEAYSPEVLDWARATFDCSVNDDYGLTEANDLAVSCQALYTTPPGSAGRPIPGRHVAVIDQVGDPLPVGEIGEIAVSSDDPVRMLRYWGEPQPADQSWYRTGDLGHYDNDGFLHVLGRQDELILVNGYRVSPAEVENQLLRHPGVIEAGVVGIPRPEHHTFEVGACVVIHPQTHASDQTVRELQDLVRHGLAPHAAPKLITFVDELPRSTTSKTRRRDLLTLLRTADRRDGRDPPTDR